MKLLGTRFAPRAALLAAIAVCSSCSHPNDGSHMSAAAKIAKPGPEESFKEIVETFRRRMEQTPIGFVVTNPNGRSTMTGQNKVSDELIKPAKEGDPYKAVITVESQSRYSVKVSADSTEDTSRDKNNSKNERLLPDDNDKDKGPKPFDPNLTNPKAATETATAKSGTSTRGGDQVLPREETKDVRKYDLIYENGRWKLLTKLDKDTEQATQNAFNSALDSQ
ncbi:MAG TPA: hypothetical protein VHU84_15360 [Lacipirellulaceae bacterium]|jgi:hypothetical protein|nr:hypothetical protein [Lacipirellulaceae bacterium]